MLKTSYNLLRPHFIESKLLFRSGYSTFWGGLDYIRLVKCRENEKVWLENSVLRPFEIDIYPRDYHSLQVVKTNGKIKIALNRNFLGEIECELPSLQGNLVEVFNFMTAPELVPLFRPIPCSMVRPIAESLFGSVELIGAEPGCGGAGMRVLVGIDFYPHLLEKINGKTAVFFIGKELKAYERGALFFLPEPIAFSILSRFGSVVDINSITTLLSYALVDPGYAGAVNSPRPVFAKEAEEIVKKLKEMGIKASLNQQIIAKGYSMHDIDITIEEGWEKVPNILNAFISLPFFVDLGEKESGYFYRVGRGRKETRPIIL